MFGFHFDPDPDILFEKLTARIGTRLGLGTQLCFEAAFKDRQQIFKYFEKQFPYDEAYQYSAF